jgi:heme-degrading monooxygenase HmoA
MISRHWRGIAKAERTENYIEHLKLDTFPRLSTIDGFIKASILARPANKGTEFLIITNWRSMEAIQKFAGESANVAVVPVAVQEMMIEYEKEVVHYNVVEDYVPHVTRLQSTRPGD